MDYCLLEKRKQHIQSTSEKVNTDKFRGCSNSRATFKPLSVSCNKLPLIKNTQKS